MPYANAAEVLPPEVLRKVQKHFTGRLYVPMSDAFYRRREKKILQLRRDGKSVRDIARQVSLCERRVQQVIRSHEAK